MPPCWRLWRRSQWLPQTLHRRPGNWGRNQGGVGNHPTYPWPTWKCFGAWGSCQFGGDGHHMEAVTTDTPGFSEPLATGSGPPPLKDADSVVGVSQGTQLDLSSLGSMQMVIIQNTLMGELQYHYENRVISKTSLHLTSPDYLANPTLTRNLRNHEQVNHSKTLRRTLNQVNTHS